MSGKRTYQELTFSRPNDRIHPTYSDVGSKLEFEQNVRSEAAMASKISWRTGAGLVLVSAALVVLVFASGHVDRFQLPANESSAVGSLRTIYSECIAYAKGHPEDGYPRKLTDLSWRSDNPVRHDDREWMIDPALADGLKTGYRFAYIPRSTNAEGKLNAYEVSADPLAPGKYGKRHFFMNETGVIHVSETGPASARDPLLQ